MTKRERKRNFIRSLHFASPEFKKDFETFETLLSSLDSVPSNDEPALQHAENELSEKRKKLESKWPRASDFIQWPSFEEWTKDWNSPSNRLSDVKALFSSLVFKQAELEGIEIDPWLMLHPVTNAVIERLFGENPDPDFAKKLYSNQPELKTTLRQSRGESLFSRAAIVIPIYPETNKDDIDWGYVEKLKKLAYGSSYRPKKNRDEIALKVFRAGQLLEQGKAFKSWQEIADAFELPLATARNIYDRAHELVYGVLPDKRTYVKAGQDSSADEGSHAVNDLERYFGVVNEDSDREICHRCEKAFPSTNGKYSPHHNPDREYDEIFVCDTCLLPTH